MNGTGSTAASTHAPALRPPRTHHACFLRPQGTSSSSRCPEACALWGDWGYGTTRRTFENQMDSGRSAFQGHLPEGLPAISQLVSFSVLCAQVPEPAEPVQSFGRSWLEFLGVGHFLKAASPVPAGHPLGRPVNLAEHALGCCPHPPCDAASPHAPMRPPRT